MTSRDELRDLAAAAALGPLAADEEARLAAALADDAALRAEADALAATVEALATELPRAPLPAGLFDRIAAQLELPAPVADPPPAPAVSLADARRRRRPLSRPLVAAASALVAAAAAAAITYVAVAPADRGAPAVEATLAAAAPGAAVSGTVRLYDPGATDGTLVVDLDAVPAAPAGHHYEVWVLRDGATEMQAVGAFVAAEGTAHLELPLPGAGPFAAVDISVEEDDGPPQHSQESLAGARLA